MTNTEEFNRQVENLLQKEYPKHAGISVDSFRKQTEALKLKLPQRLEKSSGQIPFVIVVKGELVSPHVALPLIEIKGEKGVVNMEPVEPEDFNPISGLSIPISSLYLLVDVSTGRDTLNVRPEDALKTILSCGRFPLTIDEGVSLLTQFPEILTDKKKYNAFQMCGSRRADQRVPSIWTSYGKPRLGWCWDRNPHTWLGSASCAVRIG
ncbi:MAG: DUF5701 family protein [Patescibacteria group bacterium]|jgi:hypothetical protein